LTQELAKISEKLNSTEENLEAKTATLNQVLQVQQENLASLNQSVASEVAAIKKTVADFRELVRKSEDTCKAESEEAKKMAKQEADAARSLVDFQMEQFNRTVAKVEEKSFEMAENFESQISSQSKVFNQSILKVQKEASKLVETFEKTKENLIETNEKTLIDFKSEIAENLTATLLANNEKAKTNVETLSLQLALERKNHELTHSKCTVEKLAIEHQAKECANQIENLSLKYANGKLALEQENEKLNQEIIDLKKETQDRENALKLEFNEIVSKSLAEFKNELMNEARP
jgi:hypothetical protein